MPVNHSNPYPVAWFFV